LGHLVGTGIVERFPELEKQGYGPELFASVIAAACLAHDLGNPPFGHFGESAIGGYFREGQGASRLQGLTPAQAEDLKNFEGNALGFRMLVHTLPGQSNQTGGLALTYAALGAFMKYPREAGFPGKAGAASEKKFGFFQSEREIFRAVAERLGLIWKNRADGAFATFRHPLAFLVEAADDICYRIVDLEDGFKLNLLGFGEVESLLREIAIMPSGGERYSGIIDDREKLNYLRARSISVLVKQAAELFLEKYDDILTGAFDRPLIESITAAPVLDEIEQLSYEKLYQCRIVVEIQAAGFEILSGLMDIFLGAVLGGNSSVIRNVRKLIPAQFLLDGKREIEDPYTLILNICHYISGMTDTFALDTYKRLKGISLPSY
jgi:dGTPase